MFVDMYILHPSKRYAIIKKIISKVVITKEGKKKESSFNGLDFEQIPFFTFFVQLIKKWSKTKLLQIKILTYLYK